MDDGYIASSHNEEFWNDFNNSEMRWDRKIIAEGTAASCLQIEQTILKEIDIKDDKLIGRFIALKCGIHLKRVF